MQIDADERPGRPGHTENKFVQELDEQEDEDRHSRKREQRGASSKQGLKIKRLLGGASEPPEPVGYR